MNASLRQKEEWPQPGPSQSLRLGASSEHNEIGIDRAVEVTSLLLRAAVMAGRAGRWLWRNVVGHESMVREENWASSKEEELRNLRAEIRNTMHMKI